MNHYNRGRAKEWAVRDELTANGYEVIRAAGSKGAMDLVAFKPGETLFVQVKVVGQNLAPTPWNRLYDLARQIGAIPVLAECAPRKPITWRRLAARKERAGARSPYAPFALDRVGDVS